MKFLFVALSLFTSLSLRAQSLDLEAANKTKAQETIDVFNQSAFFIVANLDEAIKEINQNPDSKYRGARLFQSIHQIADIIEQSSKNGQNFYYQIQSRENLIKYLVGDASFCNSGSSLCRLFESRPHLEPDYSKCRDHATLCALFSSKIKIDLKDDANPNNVRLQLNALVNGAKEKANEYLSSSKR